MKKALCIQDRNEFIEALTNQSDKLFEARLVDREICEKPDCDLVHLIPYGTIFSFDLPTGIAGVLTYNRPTKSQGGDGEKQLMGNASVGFGGHIDEEELLVYQSKQGEGDDTVYLMTAKDLLTSAVNTLNKELIEELGENFFNLLQEVASDVQLDVITEPTPDEVGKRHVGIAAFFPVSPEDLEKLFQACVVQPNEVVDLRIMHMNIGTALTSFDSTFAAKYIISQISEKQNFENWTKLSLEGIYLMIINLFRSRIDYQWLFRAFVMSEEHRRQQEAMKATQENDETPATLENENAGDSVQVVEAANDTDQPLPVGVIESDEKPTSIVSDSADQTSSKSDAAPSSSDPN